MKKLIIKIKEIIVSLYKYNSKFLDMFYTSAVSIVFVLVIIFAYRYSNKTVDKNKLPVIVARDSNIKILPKNRGGMNINNTDKIIYEYISGNKNNIANRENIIKQKPNPPKQVANDENKYDPYNLNRKNDKTDNNSSSLTNKINNVMAQKEQNNIMQTNNVITRLQTNNVRQNHSKSNQIEETVFLAQAGAFTTMEKVNREVKYIQKYLPDMKDSNFIITKYKNGGTVLYRLRIGPFANKTSVIEFCNKLYKVNKPCFTIKNVIRD